WYYNIQDTPEVEINVKGERMTAEAEELEGELKDELWQELVDTAPAFARYREKTDREIPLLILRPREK
ncbi:MAG: nitroreductase/quinone reductase family protein, partial [Halobacteria archaeon]|nr:nitroreductase/quinone reductase family protein [Halobacteria archaeon]